MPSILIIDDDASLRAGLRRALQKAGYTVVEACNGLQGLQSLTTTPIDLVLLDVFMPDKDGLETIKELRAAKPEMRVIVMSGGGTKGAVDVLQIARYLGASRTLVKPFSRGRLLEAVWEELMLV
ncbi:MAG: response regulator [Nitrospirae bacterium]|nr:response regulator [Nitrospirota bacterium]